MVQGRHKDGAWVMQGWRKYWRKGGPVVRPLTCHQCGPGLNPGVDAIGGLSLLLVVSFTPKGFSPGFPLSS